MGLAKIRAIEESKTVEFDFSAPKFCLSMNERRGLFCDGAGKVTIEGLSLDDDVKCTVLAVRIFMNHLVQSKYPQGAARKDGKIWAAWMEAFDDDEDANDPVLTIPYSHVKWLRDIAIEDDLKLRAGFSQWREAFIDYIETVKPVEKKVEAVPEPEPMAG